MIINELRINELKTSDGVKIVGDFEMPTGAKKAVLLLHMMPSTRVSWKSLTEDLNKAGFATLAIDLRGHGESAATLDYKKFTDAEHQASRLDVDAAINFLKQNKFSEENISFAGASIGANLSLDALYRYAGTSRAVLLSPGLNYRGIKTEAAMRGLNSHQKVWLVAAEGDEYSAQSVRALKSLQAEKSVLTIFPGGDHGTTLFKSQPKLINDIAVFLHS